MTGTGSPSSTLTRRGIVSDEGRAWISVHARRGYVDLDSHGLPRPLDLAEGVHLIGRVADALTATFGAEATAQALAGVRLPQIEEA